MTKQDVINNPSIVMLEEDNMTEELKELAISLKPHLIETLSGKTDNLVRIAFENGHLSDDILNNLNNMSDDSIAKFVTNADKNAVKEFMERTTRNLNAEGSKAVSIRFPDLARSSLIQQSDDIDWAVIDETSYLDAKTVNPLLNMNNLTQEKVDALYKKVGKFAVLGIPMKFQTKEIKEEILYRSGYDYRFVAFDEDLAKYFVENYPTAIEMAMQKSKEDPYYDLRVMQILSVYGMALQYLDKQNEDLQMTAISNNPMAIQYAVKATDAVYLAAINADPNVKTVIKEIPRGVCKTLGIKYVKASKYEAGKTYLVIMSADNKLCYRVMEGEYVDKYLDGDAGAYGKIKKIAKVKEIEDEEIQVLMKFGMLKTELFFVDKTADADADEDEEEEE